MNATRRLRSLGAWAMLALAMLGWFVYLRPAALGGDTSYVFIHGTSMEPTYSPGDLVLVRGRGSYAVGDVVAAHVRWGARGGLVIHRVVKELPEDRYVLQGDNLDETDPWEPSANEIAGAPIARIPAVGRLAAGLAASPVRLGLVCALVAGLVVGLGGRSERTSKPRRPSLTEPVYRQCP